MNNFNIFFNKEKKKNIAIYQNEDLLNKIKNFNYNLENEEFVKYFEKRTGIQISKMELNFKEVLNTNNNDNDNENHTLRTKQRIQNCWEIYNG